MKLSIPTFLLCFAVLVGCSSEITEQATDKESVDTINLHILGNGEINFNGEMMSIAGFEKELKAFDVTDKALAQLYIRDGASMGEISDVEAAIRDKGVMRINYSQTKR